MKNIDITQKGYVKSLLAGFQSFLFQISLEFRKEKTVFFIKKNICFNFVSFIILKFTLQKEEIFKLLS